MSTLGTVRIQLTQQPAASGRSAEDAHKDILDTIAHVVGVLRMAIELNHLDDM